MFHNPLATFAERRIIIMMGYIIGGVILLIVALLAFYIIHAYNQLVKRRNRMDAQWAQIDVQLVRRADLVPNLVEAVKGYASHEREVFESVSTARNALEAASSPGQAINANDSLSGLLPRLFAVAEAYPDLKADSSFLDLQSSLKETEDKIAYARQFYNDTVLIYRDKIHQFPSSILAKMFGFKDESHYLAKEDKKGDVKIKF